MWMDLGVQKKHESDPDDFVGDERIWSGPESAGNPKSLLTGTLDQVVGPGLSIAFPWPQGSEESQNGPSLTLQRQVGGTGTDYIPKVTRQQSRMTTVTQDQHNDDMEQPRPKMG